VNLLETRRTRRGLFALLYLAEGAPIGYLWWAFPARLHDAGLAADRVALVIASLTLVWACKWLWAPLVDATRHTRWGLRGWIISAQALMGLTLLPLAFTPVSEGTLPYLWGCLLLHALCAATQDVSIDALAIRSTPARDRAHVNAWMQIGLLAGRAVFGGGALWLEKRFSSTTVVLALIVSIWLIACVVLVAVRNPSFEKPALPPHHRARAFFSIVKEVARRPSTWWALLLAAVGGAAYEAPAGLATKTLLDHNVPRETIGPFLAITAILCMSLGALAGGWFADRVNRARASRILLFLLALQTTLLALTLSGSGGGGGADSPGVGQRAMLVLAGIYLLLGAYNASTYALFMDVADERLAATQFSATMAATNLCESWSIALAGTLIVSQGYPVAFYVVALISLVAWPGIGRIVPRQNRNSAC